MNNLLRYANLPVTISERNKEEILANKADSDPYSVAELSDGERNVLLVAAEVLTANPGSLFLIDEPERHLHRSIISPLLRALFAERADCMFVISTHEINLPFDLPLSKVLLVRSCTYTNKTVRSWDADLLDSTEIIDEEFKKDILGARRKVLFVEGKENSMDKRLYSLVFPDVTIIPRQGSTAVEHAVRSIRNATNLHWVRAYGIIDRDGRKEEDVSQLSKDGIYPLNYYSVESICYEKNIREAVARQQADVIGDDFARRIEEAQIAAIAGAKQSFEHLSERMAERKIQQEFMNYLPNQKKEPLGCSHSYRNRCPCHSRGIAKRTPID